jgi:hypothetical protein
MFRLQTSSKLRLLKGGGVKSVSRGDCEKQGGKLSRLLSQLRPRIQPQDILTNCLDTVERLEGSPDQPHCGFYPL